ncbi:MAG: FAD-dependent monooxygenase [Proteobacteria bacterium]|nr:FAD-dependent monooxygenase [Pseudomonadota bacterium]
MSPSPVIIAGAGPVGLCLALYLARKGVRSVLLETLPSDRFLEQVLRAGTIHPATLEMLDELGLYQALESRGLIAPTVAYWDRHNDTKFAEFDHTVLKEDTRFPYVLQCDRLKIVEEAWRALQARDACTIRMGTTLNSFTQTEDGVEAVVTNEAGEVEAIPGSFIVSGEGSHSLVRKALGIEFEGYTYPERTLILSVAFDYDKAHGYAYRNYLSDPVEWANLFKWGNPAVWRVVLPTLEGEDPDALLTDESVQARLNRLLPRDQPYEVATRSLYTVHQRIATTFRKGRAIIAGDAAHVNSPIGGMGMNSVDGRAGLDVLDRYSRQRRHVAVNHTKLHTERNKKLLAEQDPAVREKNHDEIRRTAEDPARARQFLLRTSLIQSVREAEAIA